MLVTANVWYRLSWLWNDSRIYLNQLRAIQAGLALQPGFVSVLSFHSRSTSLARDADLAPKEQTLPDCNAMGLHGADRNGCIVNDQLDLEISLLGMTDFEMKRKKVTIGNSHLDVVDIGKGPVILFVHGFPLDHSIWRFQIEEFSQSNRVVCPDLSGFGTSTSGQERLTMRSMANELAMMLDELQVDEPVCYCGLSMGGYIGWEFWRQHRNRLSYLVACDTRAAADSETVRRARKISAESVLQNGTKTMASEMTAKLLYEKNRTSEIATHVHDTILKTNPSRIAEGQIGMSERSDATDWLKEIEVPTLFVVGEFDEITTPKEMKLNAELVTDAQYLVIPKSGHLAPLENPGRFNEGLAQFLQA